MQGDSMARFSTSAADSSPRDSDSISKETFQVEDQDHISDEQFSDRDSAPVSSPVHNQTAADIPAPVM